MTLVAMLGREEVGSAQAKPPPSLVPTRYSALVGREGDLSTSVYLTLSGDFSLPSCSAEGGGLSANVCFTPFRYLPLPPCARSLRHLCGEGVGDVCRASLLGGKERGRECLRRREHAERLGVRYIGK